MMLAVRRRTVTTLHGSEPCQHWCACIVFVAVLPHFGVDCGAVGLQMESDAGKRLSGTESGVGGPDMTGGLALSANLWFINFQNATSLGAEL